LVRCYNDKKNRSTQEKETPRDALSTTNPTWTTQRWNLALRNGQLSYIATIKRWKFKFTIFICVTKSWDPTVVWHWTLLF